MPRLVFQSPSNSHLTVNRFIELLQDAIATHQISGDDMLHALDENLNVTSDLTLTYLQGALTLKGE